MLVLLGGIDIYHNFVHAPAPQIGRYGFLVFVMSLALTLISRGLRYEDNLGDLLKLTRELAGASSVSMVLNYCFRFLDVRSRRMQHCRFEVQVGGSDAMDLAPYVRNPSEEAFNRRLAESGSRFHGKSDRLIDIEELQVEVRVSPNECQAEFARLVSQYPQWVEALRLGLLRSLNEEQARESELGQFAAFIAHDLKNDVSALSYLVEAIQLDSGKANFDLLPAMDSQVKALRGNILTLLDFAAGSRSLNIRQVPLRPFLSSLHPFAEPILRSKSVSLDIVVAENLDSAAFDEDALSRAIKNLLINAVASTPKDSTLRLEIAESAEVTTFQLVHRVDTDSHSSTDESRGHGMGLKIVASIARAHGGSFHYEPIGTGWRFILAIPSEMKAEG